MLFPFTFAVDSTEAESNISPDNSALTLSGSNIGMSFYAKNENGTFLASDPATFSVNTDNYSGYTLSFLASSDDENATNLVSSKGDVLKSISSASDPEDFNAGNWGYLPSKINSKDNTKYQPAPDAEGVVLDSTNAANNEANNYSISLGVKADYVTAVGSYSNTFVMMAVANPISRDTTFEQTTEVRYQKADGTYTGYTTVDTSDINYESTYDWDTSKISGFDTAVYQPASVSYTVTAAKTNQITIDRKTYTLTIERDTANIASVSGAGVKRAGEVVEISATSVSGGSFGQWSQTTGTAGVFGDAAAISTTFTMPASDATIYADSVAKMYLQELTSSNCPTTATVVYDNRDETAYHVAKLADGKCWMLDNLALDIADNTIKNKLSPTNTNATEASLTSLKSGNRSANSKYATAGVSTSWSTNSYSVPLVNMTSKDVVPNNAPVGGAGFNKVGGYYNYCAASAGSYCFGDGTSYGSSSGSATENICPAGWTLPSGNTSGKYNTMYSTNYNSDYEAFRTALSLPFAGYYYSGSAKSKGSLAHFWSSTRNNGHYMYDLSIDTSSINTSSRYGRDYGLSVRCIAKN